MFLNLSYVTIDERMNPRVSDEIGGLDEIQPVIRSLQRGISSQKERPATLQSVAFPVFKYNKHHNKIPVCRINLKLKHCYCGRLTHWQFYLNEIGDVWGYRKCFECMTINEKVAVRCLYNEM